MVLGIFHQCFDFLVGSPTVYVFYVGLFTLGLLHDLLFVMIFYLILLPFVIPCGVSIVEAYFIGVAIWQVGPAHVIEMGGLAQQSLNVFRFQSGGIFNDFVAGRVNSALPH